MSASVDGCQAADTVHRHHSLPVVSDKNGAFQEDVGTFSSCVCGDKNTLTRDRFEKLNALMIF